MKKLIHLHNTNFLLSRKFSSKPSELLNLQTCIALLQSCAKKQREENSIGDAVSVFNSSTHLHNVFVYNSIIPGLASNDFPLKAFEFYCQMRLLGVAPDKFTFPCAIKACSCVEDLKNIHGLLFKFRLNFDLFIGSALVRSYLKFDMMDDALKVFDKLPEKDDIVVSALMIVPNRFTVTGVLSAIALAADVYKGKLVDAFAIKTGDDLGIAVSNALIDMYGKCRQLEDALLVSEGMIDIHGTPSLVLMNNVEIMKGL